MAATKPASGAEADKKDKEKSSGSPTEWEKARTNRQSKIKKLGKK